MECYLRWASSYYNDTPSLCHTLCCLPHLDIKHRKAVLTLCRAQVTTINQNSRVAREFAREWRTKISYSLFANGRRTLETFTLKELMLPIIEIGSPVVFSFLSTAVRMAPYHDYTSVIEVKEQTIKKEIQAAITTHWNADIDWTPIFSSRTSDRWIRPFPNLPLSPQVHQQLNTLFRRAARSLSGQILYPRSSKKTIGSEAREIADWVTHSHIGPAVDRMVVETTRDVERYYHLTGRRLEGPVEMRVAWKYNDLKPRVYYAQGSSVYHDSKYIQAAFNVILDCFDFVHRVNRYSLPEDRVLKILDILFIYDYASFTSNLEAIKAFTRQLVTFLQGVLVVIVDTYHGPMVVDIGDIILRYTENCNESSVFDVQRVLELEYPQILAHTCGMLGVPGNISSCTLLHGLHLCILLESILRGRCVGDDALGTLPGGAKEETFQNFMIGVNNLGSVAAEKVSTWELEDDPEDTMWHYTKRPLTRVDANIQQGIVLVFPSIANFLFLQDNHHSVPVPSIAAARKTFIAQWRRLLDRIHLLEVNLSEADRDILFKFQNGAYRSLGLEQGGLVRCKDSGSQYLLPARQTKDDFGRDWREITYDRMQGVGLVEVPAYYGIHEAFVGYTGERFMSRSSKMLSLLEDLGYCEKEIVVELVNFSTMPKFEAIAYLDRRYPFTYTYTVISDFPEWVEYLQYLELMPPHERVSDSEPVDIDVVWGLT